MTAAIGAPMAQAQTPTVLHTFTGGNDGANPNGGLLLHAAKLYGTTVNGGYLDNGTVFQWDLSTGRKTVLHIFTGGTVDGASPAGDVTSSAPGGTYYTNFTLGFLFDAAINTSTHCCPVRSRTESTGCRDRANRHRSRMREVPVRWAFSRKV
jgi:uncharacterized repeat protein (TIGR03803 family)